MPRPSGVRESRHVREAGRDAVARPTAQPKGRAVRRTHAARGARREARAISGTPRRFRAPAAVTAGVIALAAVAVAAPTPAAVAADEASTVTARRAIDSYVRGLRYDPTTLLGVVADGTTVTERDPQRSLGEDSVIRTTYRDVGLRKNLDEVVLMDPGRGVIYPGALVIADRMLAQGRPRPLAIPRGPVRISINLPGLTGSSRVVRAPSNSSVQDAIAGLTRRWNATAFRRGYRNAARSFLEVSNAYTSQQIKLKLGLSAKWPSGSAATVLDVNTESEGQTAVAYFKQVFYTVTMDVPARPSAVFGRGVTVKSLARVTGSAKPPGYVRSVDYGRLLMLKMETSKVHNSIDVSAALRQVAGGKRIGVNLDAKYEKIVADSTFTVVAIGGRARDAAVFSGRSEDFAKLAAYISDGAVYSKDNPGEPIAYVVAFLKDHRPARMGDTTSFTEANSVVYPNGFVEVRNKGVYVARFFVNYEELVDVATDTWKPVQRSSGRKPKDTQNTWYIPGDARGVRVRGEVLTFDLGIPGTQVWENAFDQTAQRSAEQVLLHAGFAAQVELGLHGRTLLGPPPAGRRRSERR